MTDQQQQDAPELAVWLGYGGLVPFASVPRRMAARRCSPPMELIGAANYGAVILSFVGAIHWGLRCRMAGVYWFSWSVTPALLAWAAVSLLDVG